MKNFAKFALVLLAMLSSTAAVKADSTTVLEEDGKRVTIRTWFDPCINQEVSDCTCECIECLKCKAGPSLLDFICDYRFTEDTCPVNSNNSSIIDNFTFNHIHQALDFGLRNDSQRGCSTCSGDRPKSSVPTLALGRYHRFRDINDPSSYGPGVFGSYDITLSISKNGTANRARLFVPELKNPLKLDDGLNYGNNGDVLDGVYVDSVTNMIKELRLTDGRSGTGNLVTDIYQAKGAVLFARNGNKYLFDVIQLDAPGDQPLTGASVWRHNDVGAVASVGSAKFSGTANDVDVQGGGADIWGTKDKFRFVYKTITGDFDITTRINSIQNTDPYAKAGVMVRQSTAVGSIYAMAGVTPTNGFTFQKRTTLNGNSTETRGWTTSFPHCWVRLVRQGTIIRAYRGANSNEAVADWVMMGSAELASTDPVLVGMCVTAHNSDALCKAEFRYLTLEGNGSTQSWQSSDIGICPPGTTTVVGTDGFDIQGSGSDIWNNADGFRYVYKSVAGDFDVKTRVASVQNTNVWAKAGVMVRQSTAANSIHACALASASSGFAFQRRTATGGSSTTTAGGSTAYPNSWVRISRQGATVHAYKATDETGATWTEMGSVDLATTDPVLIGLCVSSHDETLLCNAQFRNVAMDGAGITGDWQSLDIGTGKPGTTTELGTTSNTFTIRASGSDIWNQNDEGHFVYQALRGNGTLTARVASLSRTDGWAKAGVMFRESLAANSKFAFMLISSDNGLAFQRRTTTGASALHTAGPAGVTPQWVRLVRADNTISGYYSADGQTWTLAGQATITLGTDIFVGLAATSHSDGYLSQSMYDNVILDGTPTPEGEWPPLGLSNMLGGRLTRMEDKNGYGITLTYKYNPSGHPDTSTEQQAAIAESPARQWQINTVTDATGQQLVYTYNPNQVSGRWVVSQVALPNSQVVQYQYLNGQLSQVQLPDGTVSTFYAELDTDTQCTVMHYDDAAADGIHRRKKAYLTSNFVVVVSHLTETASIWNASSLLIRMVVNGNGEVTYLNMPHPTNSAIYKIYEGAGKVKEVYWGKQVRYLQDGWTYVPDNGYNTFSGTLESTYFSESFTNFSDFTRQRPPSATSPSGVTKQYEYYNTDLIKKVTYSDGSTEEYEYNQFQQVTRDKDRDNRVTKYTYDDRGNMLTREVGILCVNGTDTNQPEHATYTWEYYPAGHQNQYLLKTEFDALGGPSLPDTHRTDYVYDANQRLVQVIQGADVPSSTRGVTTYTYDTAGRLTSEVDPVGRQLDYAYDNQNRIITVEHYTYPAHSTEKYFYGATGTQDANLLVKYKDQNGIVTKYEYDSSGRKVRTIQAYSTMDDAGNETLITDSNAQTVETVSYLPGTSVKSQFVRAGNQTDFTYDYLQRLKSTTVHPRAAVALIDSLTYVNNLLFCSQDRYGFKTYCAYRASDSARVRIVRGLTPNFSLADFAAVNSLVRAPYDNPDYVIEDYELDSEGQHLATVDARGIRLETTYDSRGQVTTQIEAKGTPIAAKTAFEYDLNGNQTKMILPRSYSVDPSGTIFTRPGTDGDFVTQVTRNGRNLASSVTRALSRPEETTEYYTYYFDGRIQDKMDGRGNIWTTKWRKCCPVIVGQLDPPALVDDTNTLKRATQISGTDYGNRPTYSAVVKDLPATPTQDWWRNPTDADTVNEMTTRFDALGRPAARCIWLSPLSVSNAWVNPPIAGENSISPTSGLTTKWAYDQDLTDGVGLDSLYSACISDLGFGIGSRGSATLEIAPAGEQTLTIFDGLGRVIRVVRVNSTIATSVVADTAYDELVAVDGKSLAQTKMIRYPNGLGGSQIVTRNCVDGAGLTRKSIDAIGQVSVMQYDPNGNLKSFRDPNGVGFDATIDERNLEIQRFDTLDAAHNGPVRIAWNEYDSHNNLIKTNDAYGKETTSNFDGLDRRVQVTDRMGGVTLFKYDKNSNLLEIMDADAVAAGATQPTTLYRYDARNLRILEAFRDDVVEANYSADDSEYTQFDLDDRCIYGYDASRRIIKRIDQSAVQTEYIYNFANCLLTRMYPDGLNDIYQYDADCRLLSAHSTRYNNTILRGYDNAGRLSNELLTIFGVDYSLSYGYDAANRKISERYPNGQYVVRTYTDRDQLSSISFDGSSIVSLISYDVGGREISRMLANNVIQSRTWRTDNLPESIVSNGIMNLNYTWDFNKRKTSEINNLFPSKSNIYDCYDDEDRLTGWHRATSESQTWSLSKAGDWNNTVIDGVEEDRTHNAVHEIITVTPPVPAAQMNYDTKGNLIHNIRGHDYCWDCENRLVRATVNIGGLGIAGTHTYSYDALGRRISKVVNDVTTVFINNSYWQEISEYQDGLMQRNYIFYNSYIDEPACLIYNNHVYYYHSNDIFSIVALSDSSGNVVEYYDYNPYGKMHILMPDNSPINTSTVGEALGFTGRRLDSETDLLYYRARQYDSRIGRFLSRDKYRYESSFNLYQYALSNPLIYIDPSGNAQLTISDAVEKICKSIDKYIGKAKSPLCKKICPEHLLSIFIKESQLDPEAYYGKGWLKTKEIKKGDLDKYPSGAGLGGVTSGAADEIARVARNRLSDYSPPSNTSDQSGVDPFVTKGYDVKTGASSNSEARQARYDPQANSDMATLTLIDSVSKNKTLESGIQSYGPPSEKDYGKKVMAGSDDIAAKAKCKDPKCCTCDEIKAWAKGLGAKDADTRNEIYKKVH